MYEEQIHAIEALMTPLNEEVYVPLAFAKVRRFGERGKEIEVVTRVGSPVYLQVGDKFRLDVTFTENGSGGPTLVSDTPKDTPA